MKRRSNVCSEAYELYLYYTKEFKSDELEALSDDELLSLYNKYVSEKGIEEEADEWIHRYCRSNM